MNTVAAGFSSPLAGAAVSGTVFEGAEEFVAATGAVVVADEEAGGAGPYASIDAAKNPLSSKFP